MTQEKELAKLNADLHIHSNHSCDAESRIDEMCQGAISKGLSIVCFTEHVDMNLKDEGYGYFQYDKYTQDIELAREKYKGQLEILKGVEFSEPHVYPRAFETVTKADFDFILGSVHWLDEFGAYWDDDSRLLPNYPTERLFQAYYQEVLKAVRFGGFDSLAHIDFPKRYLLKKYEPVDMLNEVMAELLNKGIALELNSHPIRKEYPEINPSDNICTLYARYGGAKVTTGSDAHRPENIGQDFHSLDRVIHLYSFKPVYFKQRKEVRFAATHEPITVSEDDPSSPASRRLIEQSDAYLSRLYPAESNHLLSIELLQGANVTFITARSGVAVVGCGAFINHGEYVEIKRMLVLPDWRGKGIGWLILTELENRARSCGLSLSRLETGVSQLEAMRLYERCGYEHRGPFSPYIDDPLSVFMEKKLT